MKKVSIAATLLVIATAAFIFLRPNKNPDVVLEKSVAKTTPAAPLDGTVPATRRMVKIGESSPATPTGFLNSDVMNAVRAALAREGRAGLEDAQNQLMEYIRANSDKIDDYVDALKNEKDEYVLRTFAIALAEADRKLLLDDKIVGAAIELAKDSSFEQRQHIMLNLLAKSPEMRDDVFDAIIGLSKQDPNSQVKTSAVTVLADWMESFPEKNDVLLSELAENFKSAKDDDVKVFTYQILALHRDALPEDLQAAIGERFKTEEDPFNRNLLAIALSDATDNIREDALTFAQTAFDSERDTEKQRNLLVQIVCLGKENSRPLLGKNSKGDSLLAQDAREYLALFAAGTPFEPEAFLQAKAIRDAQQHAAHEAHPDHKD